MRNHTWLWAVVLWVEVALVLGLMHSGVTPARANGDLMCVNPTGTACDGACVGCFASLRHAVLAAAPGDIIRVAAGAYVDPGGTLASITQPVTIIGGWDPTCGSHDPEIYPVVLDAQGGGSVIRVEKNAGEVWLEHLTLTGGDGTGNCGTVGCGGGLYIDSAIVHLHNATVIANNGSTVATGGALGGGIFAMDSEVDIRQSRILSNTAALVGDHYGYGGGVFLSRSAGELVDNEIAHNVGSVDYSGSGGVHLLDVTYAQVLANTIRDNEANRSDYWGNGGGLVIGYSAHVVVAGNRIEGNAAGLFAGIGGGISVENSDALLTRNIIADNTGGSINDEGSGVCIRSTLPVTLSNNLLAYNHGGPAGSEGVYVEIGGSLPSVARLYNNTIVGNGDAGVRVSTNADVTLVNNIIADHALGIDDVSTGSSTIAADNNLLWNADNPVVGSDAVQEDPAFATDYHLRSGSPALNAGEPLPWLTVDLDGRPRPQDGAWDIGAFEGIRWATYLPLVVRETGVRQQVAWKMP